MSKLTDMEELLSQIKKVQIRDYMHEAYVCYSSGAYRGSIVLSFIALFEDIVDKLSELTSVNDKAKEIYKEVRRKQAGQAIYENYLIEQLSSNNILSELECSSLNLIRERRNKAAHPSGHQPSAEEARFVFYETITKFLSKPKLVTTQLVDEIISRLSNQNFFPYQEIDKVSTTVKYEIEDLHPESYTYLVVKLVEVFKNGNDILRRNANYFISGLANIRDDVELCRNIKEKVLKYNADNVLIGNVILGCISSNPNLLNGLDEVTIARIRKILNERILDDKLQNSWDISHPFFFFRGFYEVNEIDQLFELFSNELETYIEKYPYQIKGISKLLNNTMFYKKYIDVLCRIAASGNFDTANAFAERCKEIEGDIIEYLANEDALRIILSILEAAIGGAWGSQAIRDGNFEAINEIKQKAKTLFLYENKELAEEIIKGFSYLIDYDYDLIKSTYFKD